MIHNFDTGPLSHRELQASFQDAKLLSGLAPPQMLRLTTAGTIRRFSAREIILSQGAEMNEIYVIQRGMVSVGLFQEQNPGLWLYVSGPNSVVDLMALLDPPSAPLSIHALTEVEALAVPREVLREVLREEPALETEILRSLCARLNLIACVAIQEFLQPPPGPSSN